jgi:DNA-binding NtrC family response regulator
MALHGLPAQAGILSREQNCSLYAGIPACLIVLARNVMERSVLLSGGETIRSSHCLTHPSSPIASPSDGYYDLSLDQACDCFTRDYLSRLLTRYGGDTQKVADHAKVHVTSIRRKIRELGIAKDAG